jgi:hypothetical protein
VRDEGWLRGNIDTGLDKHIVTHMKMTLGLPNEHFGRSKRKTTLHGIDENALRGEVGQPQPRESPHHRIGSDGIPRLRR